ncbi:hypothetical protein VOLCADRAFT_90015 [Volvox carteri f. nagariensis]|uniref:Uncharacterized protein n=1 Tax=Volvox carteri f. nagariensis TaxID=3068 RepID=D8TT96_VOLCA|nr:uncharacterized protein VOLCADRAFT_90015 [Volvox carteri f. nagariensis]EFJ49269.1 hypothetical protein VOLCADRAFT_90015 [Volvox carteri f. nagariensis]|eukprot:XP_002949717.1 hypothetical protein VOLCADRAFT_90015 [Volvox carteri f. nagariensis]
MAAENGEDSLKEHPYLNMYDGHAVQSVWAYPAEQDDKAIGGVSRLRGTSSPAGHEGQAQGRGCTAHTSGGVDGEVTLGKSGEVLHDVYDDTAIVNSCDDYDIPADLYHELYLNGNGQEDFNSSSQTRLTS